MSAPGRFRQLLAARQRVLPILALVAATGACASLRSEAGYQPPRTAVLFENTSAEPVRVWLVERHGIAYKLGKVEPMQRQVLLLPAHLTSQSDRQVALVVVPMSRNRGMPYPDAEAVSRAHFSSVAEVASQRWMMTSLFLFGTGVLPR